METLKIELKNCYGIKKLKKVFSFNDCKANAVYAKNGIMKTSLAKVFHKIQNNKASDIKDLIFPQEESSVCVEIDGNEDISDKVFVIKSFENSYESKNITSLLINEDLSEKLSEVIKQRENFLKSIENYSGLKVTKMSSGKKIYEIEEKIISDLSFANSSILQNLEYIDLINLDYNFSNIQYSLIFDTTNLKKIQSERFQQSIHDYLLKVDELYDGYSFLEKGKFTLPKLVEIQKRLQANNFYEKDNRVSLEGIPGLHDEQNLQSKINELSTIVTSTKEFKEIEKLLSDVKGMQLKDILEKNPEIVSELKAENLPEFRKKLWLSYFQKNKQSFDDLLKKFTELKESINAIDKDSTPWNKALEIFNNRFTLPFRMEIENLTSSIIGESLPKAVFSFNKTNNFLDEDENNWVRMNRDELEEVDTLSQGEKRALYLLNIIFDIEVRKNKNIDTLFIIDDIADSFDYKNKYAIVEYLNDIIKEPNFRVLILTHNFDFYRTIASRLPISRNNRHEACLSCEEIKINEELYQNRPFDNWKAILKAKTRYGISYTTINAKKHIIALIPFVRNLIDFGVDKKIIGIPDFANDYTLLTSLLHIKPNSSVIDINILKLLYKEYIGKDDFDTSISNDTKVLDIMADLIHNHIAENSVTLEDKIILSIGIRHKAERYMIEKINDEPFWTNIIGNQTRVLFNKYKELFPSNHDTINILESVNILTPENIHLNSFMYEPILDMDTTELKGLLNSVTALS